MKLVGMVLVASIMVVMQAGVSRTVVTDIPSHQASSNIQKTQETSAFLQELDKRFGGDVEVVAAYGPQGMQGDIFKYFTGVCVPSVASLPVRQELYANGQTTTVASMYMQQAATLGKSIHFLKDVYCCTTNDLSLWFAQQARATDGKLMRVLRAGASDRLDSAVTDDLHAAIVLLEKTTSHERVLFNPEERGYIKFIIMKHKKIIPNAQRALSFLSVANWLWKQATKIFTREAELNESRKVVFKAFPAQELSKKIASPTLKNIFISFANTGSLDEFFAAWDTVEAFFNNNQRPFLSFFTLDATGQIDISAAMSGVLKDFTGLTAVFMHYLFLYFVQGTVEQKAMTIEQLLDLYNKVNSLPIVDAIAVLSTLAQQISFIIDALRQQDGGLDFGQWLKENWIVFPIVVGVIVIKVAQYFYQQNNG
jgi:hypothetical protein